MPEQSGGPEKRDYKTGQSKPAPHTPPEKKPESAAAPQKAAAPEKKPENAAAPTQGSEKAAAPGRAEENATAPGKPEVKAAASEKSEEKTEAPAEDKEKVEAREKVEALERRIKELEERNGRVKWVAALAVIALACAVIAIVCAAVLGQPKPAPRVLQAEGIELNDPHGRYRAEIGEYGSGWGVFLFDREDTKEQAMSSAVAAAPQIEIRLGKGDNRLVVRGAAPHKSAVDLGVNKLGWPCVTLFDKEAGVRRAEIGETEIPSEGKLEKRAPDSVVLSDKQGNPVWKAGETATDFAPVAPATPAH